MPQTKMAVWGGLTYSCEEKRSENRGEKERYPHLNAEFQRIARRDKKAFFSDQSKETEWERLEISSRKLEIPKEHFMQFHTIMNLTRMQIKRKPGAWGEGGLQGRHHRVRRSLVLPKNL